MSEVATGDWGAFPFDEELTFEAIPDGQPISAIHVSVVPEPPEGGVRILGRMANGGVGSITLVGKVHAAKLPFADRVVRVQYFGGTRSVAIALSSHAA
jgi:hypothetical protein